MTYFEFLDLVECRLKEVMPDAVKMERKEAVKNNGITYRGFSFACGDHPVMPTLYFEEMFKAYQQGMGMDRIVQETVRVLEKAFRNAPVSVEDLKTLGSFESIKDRLICRLVNYEGNQSMLKNVPHTRFLDLAVIYSCVFFRELPEGTDVSGFMVEASHLHAWGITKDMLHEQAVKNTRKLFPGQVTDMDFFYVVTNQNATWGAATLLYQDILEKLAGMFPEGVYLIPSSIHEFLAVPKPQGEPVDLAYMSEIVKEVNALELRPEEVLSNHAYFYHASTGVIEY